MVEKLDFDRLSGVCFSFHAGHYLEDFDLETYLEKIRVLRAEINLIAERVGGEK